MKKANLKGHHSLHPEVDSLQKLPGGPIVDIQVCPIVALKVGTHIAGKLKFATMDQVLFTSYFAFRKWRAEFVFFERITHKSKCDITLGLTQVWRYPKCL